MEGERWREERDVNGGREKVKWNWSYNWREEKRDNRWGGISRFLVFNRHGSNPWKVMFGEDGAAGINIFVERWVVTRDRRAIGDYSIQRDQYREYLHDRWNLHFVNYL